MKTKFVLMICCILFLTGCPKDNTNDIDESKTQENTTTQEISQLDGEVYYLQRKLLPPNSILHVTLEEVSKMDVASTVVSKTEQVLQGAPPYTFSISYDAKQINTKKAYSLRATITSG